MNFRLTAPLGAFMASALVVLPACSANGTAAPGLPVTTQSQTSSIDSPQAAQSSVATEAQAVRSVAESSMVRAAGPSVNFVTEKPAPAASFVDAIGLDSAFGASATPYVERWSTISAALINLGVKHLRDGSGPNESYIQRMSYLGSHGIYHSIGFMIAGTTPSFITSELNAFAPYVDFVEPQNEYDGNSGSDPNWVSHIRAEQTMLYDTIRGNSAFSRVKVLGPSLSNVSNASKLGPIDSLEDGGNFHYATCDFIPSTSGLYTYTGYLRESTKYKPIWSTETGYTDNMSRPCSTDDKTIAKYLPRTVAVRWNFGEPRIYFNQLADKPSDPVFGTTGLLRSDGSPKLQYYTLQSMISLLNDSSVANTKPLQYAVTGSTQDMQHTLLQKSDGTYVLMLWLELASWDHHRRVDLTVPAQRVTLSLRSAPSSAQYYTYASNGRLNVSSLQRSTSISLSVDDSISFVVFK